MSRYFEALTHSDGDNFNTGPTGANGNMPVVPDDIFAGGGGAFSISYWVYVVNALNTPNNDNWTCGFHRDNTTGRYYACSTTVSTTGTYGLRYRGKAVAAASIETLTTSLGSLMDAWRHHLVIFRGSGGNVTEVEQFRDGTSVGSSTGSQNLTDIVTFSIGSRQKDNTHCQYLYLAEVAVYDSDLELVTDAITDLAGGANPQAIDASNLQGYYLYDNASDDLTNLGNSTNADVAFSSAGTEEPEYDAEHPTIDAFGSSGRIMGSLAYNGGLAGHGGIAGKGGGLAG